MKWHDDGVTLKLYISTAGDFVSLGTRTELPFVAGGGGIPSGWSFYSYSGSTADVNLTTANGRFSVSNASPTNAHVNSQYGIEYTLTPVTGKRYILSVQCQTMDGKSAANRLVTMLHQSGGTVWGTRWPSETPWADLTSYGGFENGSNTSLTIRLAMENINGGVFNAGIQFQSCAVTTLDETYPPPTWQEVTCEVRNFQVRSGRDRKTSRYDVGQASIGVLNDSGDFTYRPQHPWGLRPGRFVKVEAVYGGRTFAQYMGVIDGMTDSYTLDGHALTTMQCVDISSLLSNTTVPFMSQRETSQQSGYRMIQLLAGSGWHPSQQDIDYDGWYQQGILNNGRSIRDELGLGADSEGSYFFADRVGNIFYRTRDWSDARVTKVGAELLAQPDTPPIPFHDVNFVFPNVDGNYMKTPHVAAFDTLTGDIEITARLSMADWSVATSDVVVAKWQSGASSLTWALMRGNGKRFQLYAGTGVSKAATADVLYGNGAMFWIRARYVQSTGVYSFFHAADNKNEPGAWSSLGTPQTGTVNSPTPTNTAPVSVGGYGLGTLAWNGRIAEVIVRKGAGGPVVFRVNEADAYNMPGTVAFTSISQHPMQVLQTVPNVIVKDATRYEALPEVDDIPNISASIPIVCTRGLETSWSRDRVINEVSIANAGGSAVTQVDATSQSQYGPRTYQRMDLLNDDAHPEYITQRIADLMDGSTDAVLRVNAVEFRPGDTGWAWALDVWLNDLVRVRYRHPTEDWGYSVVSHVQGVEHTVTTDWVVRLSLDDFKSFNYWVGSPVGEGWDASTWDDDLWDGGTTGKWSSGQVWDQPIYWKA